MSDASPHRMPNVITQQHGTDGPIGGEPFADTLKRLKSQFNPAQERLWAKIASVSQDLDLLKTSKADPELLARCGENVTMARTCVERKGRQAHPHLAWRFLHRADEDLLLLVSDDKLRARALDVRTSFELNITEPSVRAAWLGVAGGEKGSLARAIDALDQPSISDAEKSKAREIVRAALEMVNEEMDRRFWVLSQNVSTSVVSGLLLAAIMVLCALLGSRVMSLGNSLAADYLPVALLGAMGAYVSNLITRKDFLFVQGGPFMRYFLHPVVAKPILSAFAAVFVYAVARSGLIFSLDSTAPSSTSTNAIPALHVPPDKMAFAHLVLAVISGFAADKVLRGMIDRVLKRLEEKAEKTTKTVPAENNG